MDTQTGKIYWGQEAADAARERGQMVVPVSAKVAQIMEGNRAQRRAELKLSRKLQRQSANAAKGN